MRFSREYGISVLVWISSSGYEGSIPESIKPRVMQAAMKDLDGNPIMSRAIGNTPMTCQNNPVWLEIKAEEIAVISDSDFGGFGVDEPYSNYESVNFGGCYCQYCMAGFTAYLKENLSAADLNDRGIKDIKTFNYAEYLKQNFYDEYKAALKNTDNPLGLADLSAMPLVDEFLRYQYEVSTNYMKYLRAKVDDQSEKLGKPIPMGANFWGLKYLGAADTVDCVTSEINIKMVPDANSIVAYEIGNAIDAPVLASPSSGDWEVMTGPDAAGLMKIYTAEAYAHGGIMSSPYESPFFQYGLDNSDVLAGQFDMNKLYPYYDYIYKNPMLFEHLWPTAKVGMLYSNGSMDKAYKTNAENEFWVEAMQLFTANIPMRVVFDGDGKLSQKSMTADDFDGLDLVILPGDVVLDSTDISLLSDFMNSGGQVISFNATTPISQLDGLISASGKPETELVQTVKTSYSESFTINNPSVLVTPYFSTAVSGYVFHLVNYSFDAALHDVNPQKDITMEVINDFPSDLREIGVYYKTPESNTLTELKWTASQGKLNFSIPEMSAWATVVIGQKDSVLALNQLDVAKSAFDTRGMVQLDANVAAILAEAQILFDQGHYDEMLQKCGELPK